ncbi:hypothetical protein BC940DRAFT_300534 [Gongronella butleri]|nr:hypothetical protein BC940DRAFT_300534 [Gongronella butleri]
MVVVSRFYIFFFPSFSSLFLFFLFVFTFSKQQNISKMAKVTKKNGKKGGPSAYNNFMKDHLPKVKKAHPNMSHKDAFKLVAKNWATAPENPKNKK